MKTFRSASWFASFALALLLFVTIGSMAQTAGQDMHKASADTKDAAKDTGHAVQKTTKKDTASTKSGTNKAYDKTKEGSTVAANKTKETSVKGYDRSKEGVQKVVKPNAARKSQVTDRTHEANMGAQDNAKQDKQKLDDTKPRYF